MQKFEELIQRLANDKNLAGSSEQATREVAVLPVLECLGWEIFDASEVVREFSAGDGKVDYCLKTGQKNHILIEVKRAGTPLDEHQEQLLKYSFAEGAPLAVLTDGLVWWLYISKGETNWKDRRFLIVNFSKQTKGEACRELMRFLKKEEVKNGNAVKEAQKEFDKLQQEKKAIGEIPKAWERLVSEPEELLVDLLREKTTELSEFEPSNEQVIDFLKGLVSRQDADLQNLLLKSNKSKMPRSIKIAKEDPRGMRLHKRVKVNLGNIGVTHRKPEAFWLNEVRYEVRNWIDIVIQICGQKAEEVGDNFGEYVINIKGKKRLYFSEDRDKLSEPELIPNSNFFVSKTFSAKNCLDLAKKLIEAFYDSSDSFYIEFKE